jgi:hypothetical protein
MKKCSRKECIHKGELQPESNFHKQTHSPDGLRYYCKDCDAERSKIKSDRQQANKIAFKNMFFG